MTSISAPGARAEETLKLNPFLHIGPDRIYNTLTDVTLLEGELDYAELRSLAAGEIAVDALDEQQRHRLHDGRWLVSGEEDGRNAFRLRFVSLEAHTVCNQKCYFCPVAFAPRQAYFMPTELYERILGELSAYRSTIEAVFMINYNEPTVDRRFVDQVRAIKANGLPPAVLTNGSGLTPERVDALVEMGGLRFLSINLSTLDARKYARDRGADQVELVARHLDYAAHRKVADVMEIVVLGEGDEEHQRATADIERRYGSSEFSVVARRLMDRAGYLEVGDTADHSARRLCGCENTGSRPLQHLHITPYGKCVLCCEDYDENFVAGDLSQQSVDEVLTGERFAQLRRWVYGVERAPRDFICNGCVFALSCEA